MDLEKYFEGQGFKKYAVGGILHKGSYEVIIKGFIVILRKKERKNSKVVYLVTFYLDLSDCDNGFLDRLLSCVKIR